MFNTYNFYGGSLLQIWMAKSRRDFEEKMKWKNYGKFSKCFREKDLRRRCSPKKSKFWSELECQVACFYKGEVPMVIVHDWRGQQPQRASIEPKRPTSLSLSTFWWKRGIL